MFLSRCYNSWSISMTLLSTYVMLLEAAPQCVNDICIGCSQPVQFNCPSGKVLTGELMIAYRNRTIDSTVCEVLAQDCLDLPNYFMTIFQMQSCLWKTGACSFNQIAGRSTKCGTDLRATYMLLQNYNCVNKSDIHSICLQDGPQPHYHLEGSTSEYVISPGLTSPYIQVIRRTSQSLTQCTVRLTTRAGHGFSIHTVYMDLASSDTVEIYTTNTTELLFRYQGGEERFNVSLPESDVTVVFNFRNIPHAHIGFALRFQSYNITSFSTTSGSTTNTLQTTGAAERLSSTVTGFIQSTDRGANTFDNNIVIIVLSIFIVLILTLITSVLCIVKSRQQKKYQCNDPYESTEYIGQTSREKEARCDSNSIQSHPGRNL